MFQEKYKYAMEAVNIWLKDVIRHVTSFYPQGQTGRKLSRKKSKGDCAKFMYPEINFLTMVELLIC